MNWWKSEVVKEWSGERVKWWNGDVAVVERSRNKVAIIPKKYYVWGDIVVIIVKNYYVWGNIVLIIPKNYCNIPTSNTHYISPFLKKGDD